MLALIRALARPILWDLDTRFMYRSKAQSARLRAARALPHWLRQAVIVTAAADASMPPNRPITELSGPDTITYPEMYDAA